MYKQLIIAHPWLSDRATISADSEQGSLPALNLIKSPYPTDWWRSQGSPGEVRITIHLPEVDWLLWDLVTPLYTNSSEEGTWQVIAANSEAGLASPTFEDAVRPLWPVPDMMRPGEPDWRHAFRWLKGNQRTEPWVQLIVNDPSPVVDPSVVDPFIQWGRLYVALAWQPSYHHDKGSEFTPAAEKGRRVITQGGGTRVGASAKPRTFRFNVGFLTQEEMLTKGYELDRIVGTTSDLLVVDAPEDPVHLTKKMVYGTLPDVAGQVHQDYEIYTRQYAIEEML